MAGSNPGIGRGERGLSLFPTRPSAAPGMHVVTGLVPDLTDAATREANRAAIANAINTVGAAGGGIAYIPVGHYYLQQVDISRSGAAININHNNITLRGAGIGRTVLHTRSDYTVQDGRVIRGHGIRIIGTDSSSRPRTGVTLENFELDGGAGHTGHYNWPANTTTGDGWDITHKGVIASKDDHVDHVTIRDVFLHNYRGELLYAGGLNCNNIMLQRIYSHDTNASSYNLVANNILCEDCTFGNSRSWCEIANTNVTGTTIFRRCTFYRSLRSGGEAIAFADMAGTNFYLFEHCRFIDVSGMIFGIFGDIGNNITIEIRDSFLHNANTVFYSNQRYVGPNQNINFHHNTILDVSYIVQTSAPFTDNVIDGNDFDGTGRGQFYFSNSDNTGTVVSNNIYRNVRALSGGTPTVPATFTNNTAAGSIDDTQAPSVPTGLTGWTGALLRGSHRVFLRWAESTDNIGVHGYKIYRNSVVVGDTPYPWFLNTGLSAATQYTYTVSAYDVAGNESAQSQSVRVAMP